MRDFTGFTASGHDNITVKDLLNLEQLLINTVLTTTVFVQELKINKIVRIFKYCRKENKYKLQIYFNLDT